MKKILIVAIILIGALIIAVMFKYSTIVETMTSSSGITFVPPPLSSDQNIENMKELMRIGSQGVENAKYDNVAYATLESS